MVAADEKKGCTFVWSLVLSQKSFGGKISVVAADFSHQKVAFVAISYLTSFKSVEIFHVVGNPS